MTARKNCGCNGVSASPTVVNTLLRLLRLVRQRDKFTLVLAVEVREGPNTSRQIRASHDDDWPTLRGVLKKRNDEERLESVFEAPSVRGKVRPGLRGHVLGRWLLCCCCSGKASDSGKPKPPYGNKPQVHGLSPTFSRGSTVSQVLGVSDSVASGALRAMAGA